MLTPGQAERLTSTAAALYVRLVITEAAGHLVPGLLAEWTAFDTFGYAEQIGATEQTTRNAFNLLADLDLIAVDRRPGKANRWRLILKSWTPIMLHSWDRLDRADTKTAYLAITAVSRLLGDPDRIDTFTKAQIGAVSDLNAKTVQRGIAAAVDAGMMNAEQLCGSTHGLEVGLVFTEVTTGHRIFAKKGRARPARRAPLADAATPASEPVIATPSDPPHEFLSTDTEPLETLRGDSSIKPPTGVTPAPAPAAETQTEPATDPKGEEASTNREIDLTTTTASELVATVTEAAQAEHYPGNSWRPIAAKLGPALLALGDDLPQALTAANLDGLDAGQLGRALVDDFQANPWPITIASPAGFVRKRLLDISATVAAAEIITQASTPTTESSSGHSANRPTSNPYARFYCHPDTGKPIHDPSTGQPIPRSMAHLYDLTGNPILPEHMSR